MVVYTLSSGIQHGRQFRRALKGRAQKAFTLPARFGVIGGVAENAQGHYERGERLPKSDYLMAIRRKGVDVLYVLSGERSHMSADDLTVEETEVVNQYRTLHEADQGAIAQITSSLSRDA